MKYVTLSKTITLTKVSSFYTVAEFVPLPMFEELTIHKGDKVMLCQSPVDSQFKIIVGNNTFRVDGTILQHLEEIEYVDEYDVAEIAFDSIVPSIDGADIEPDGKSPNGFVSWLRFWGIV